MWGDKSHIRAPQLRFSVEFVRLFIEAEQKISTLFQPVLERAESHMALVERMKAGLNLNDIDACPAYQILAATQHIQVMPLRVDLEKRDVIYSIRPAE